MTGHYNIYAHARALGTAAEAGCEADRAVPLGSVFKLLVLAALAAETGAGAAELGERVIIDDASRSPGPTGLSLMRDSVEISLHDLAVQMISVSDNTAADALLKRLGMAKVNAFLERAGLRQCRVRADCRASLVALAADFGVGPQGLQAALAQASPADLAKRLVKARSVDPDYANAGTPRELTALLAGLWDGKTVIPEQAVWCRKLLRTQIFRPYLAEAFAGTATVSGKSGLLPHLRGEAAVVEFPEGPAVAMAVFVASTAPALHQPAADAALADVARRLAAQVRGAAR